MTLTTGIRLGPYEIQSPLGAAAKGGVCRARDPKVNREVAIKAASVQALLDRACVRTPA